MGHTLGEKKKKKTWSAPEVGREKKTRGIQTNAKEEKLKKKNVVRKPQEGKWGRRCQTTPHKEKKMGGRLVGQFGKIKWGQECSGKRPQDEGTKKRKIANLG